MTSVPETLARTAAAAAVQLAGAVGSQVAWAVTAWPCALPDDPLPAFAGHAGRGRCLLWHAGDWMLALGSAVEITAAGPGRHMAAAQESAAVRARCVLAMAPGAPAQPVLLTALAFAEEAAAPGVWGATLPPLRRWLPRRLLWRRAGTGWCVAATAVRAGDDPGAVALRLLAEPEPVATRPRAAWPAIQSDYAALVEDACELIRDGAMRKMVVARAVDAELPADLALDAALASLHRLSGLDSTLYAYDLDDGGCFIGATPELLFQTDGPRLTTLALAGSAARSGEAGADRAIAEALFASTKERKEHGLVVEHLVAVLRPRCEPFACPPAPGVRTLPRLFHLVTPISATLRHVDHAELLGALHPTPAVCGLPVSTAAHWLRRHEHLDRGLYAGALGWSDGDACRYVVPLRGGVVHGRRARLFAGAGIVETSQPESELAETELKLRLMRQALGERTDVR